MGALDHGEQSLYQVQCPGWAHEQWGSGKRQGEASEGREHQGPWGEGEPWGEDTLTIPAALARSGLLGVKLPLWLVDTVLVFLLLRPMASMDWLRLRMTLCGSRGGRQGGTGFLGPLTLRKPQGSRHLAPPPLPQPTPRLVAQGNPTPW